MHLPHLRVVDGDQDQLVRVPLVVVVLLLELLLRVVQVVDAEKRLLQQIRILLRRGWAAV